MVEKGGGGIIIGGVNSLAGDSLLVVCNLYCVVVYEIKSEYKIFI